MATDSSDTTIYANPVARHGKKDYVSFSETSRVVTYSKEWLCEELLSIAWWLWPFLTLGLMVIAAILSRSQP